MKSKQKVLGLLVFIALIAVGYVYTNKYFADKHYEVFKIAMDKIAKNGTWTNTSYSYNILSRNFSVQGITIDLKNNRYVDITNDLILNNNSKIIIDELSIKSSLTKDDVETLLATENWVNKSKLDIASSIKITGIKHLLFIKDIDDIKNSTVKESFKENAIEVVGDETVGGAKKLLINHLDIGEIFYENVSLNASGNDNIGGNLGFMKSLSIDSLRYKNINYVKKNFVKIHLDSYELDKPSFSNNNFSLFYVLTPPSAKSFVVNNLTLSFEIILRKNNTLPIPLVLKFGKIDIQDIKDKFNFSSMALNDFSLDFDDKFLIKFEKLFFTDFDSSIFIKKLKNYLVNTPIKNLSSRDSLYKFYSEILFSNMNFYSIASYNTLELDKLDINYKGNKIITLDKYALIGPIKAYEWNKNYTTVVNKLVVNLPDVKDLYKNNVLKLIKYLSTGGVEINLAVTSNYDEATSTLTYTIKDLSLSNLFDFNFSFSLSGITKNTFDRLFNENILKLTQTLKSDEDFLPSMLGGLKLNELKISIKDLGIVNKIYEYVAKNQMRNSSTDQLKNNVVNGVSISIALAGKHVIENSEKIGQLIADFLAGNNSITLVSNPKPDLSMKALDGKNGIKVLNDLNMAVYLNDGDKIPLVFINQNIDAYLDDDDDDM